MRRIITWFVDNSVASNLLMAVLVVGGGMVLVSIRQEEFPSIDSEMVSISVPYLGATPEESEEAVCVRIEDAIEGANGIERVTAVAAEGACAVMVELKSGTDGTWALSEIESRVDRITTFPAETEKPSVTYIQISQEVMNIAIAGPADERTLKSLAQEIRDDIAALPEVSQASVSYTRPYEISIEVSESALQRHGMTFDQVATAVRNASLDLPGGSVKTAGGEILLRAKGQAYRGDEFESIAVLTRPDGTTVQIRDIATVVDGFEDSDVRSFLDGQPLAMVEVRRSGDEDILDIADAVYAYLLTARVEVPEGIELVVFRDEAKSLRARIAALLRNAGGGLVFVFIVLSLVLRLRLALWVAAGIPIALLGALILFPVFDFSISTLAVMGFILVLGIVVDDAIVVGERIYAKEEEGLSAREAAIEGTLEVSVPVIFGVLTTVAAFTPLIVVPGRMGQFFGVLGGTVILCLFLSLVEAQLILPSHLAHRRVNGDQKRTGRWSRAQDFVSRRLDGFIRNVYAPSLERVLEWRYLAVACAVGVLVLTFSLFASGRMTFQFFPGVEGDRIYATLTMPQGTPMANTQAAVDQLSAAVDEVRAKFETAESPVVQHVLVSIGKQLGRGGPRDPRRGATGGTHLAQVALELTPWNERDVTTREIQTVWREAVGAVPDAVELKYESFSMHAGDPIAIQLDSDDSEALVAAAAELRQLLAGYDGVFDISDTFRAGKQEVRLSLRPEARSLGITLNDLARQVRTAFYGTEVQRVQRGQDDVRVMVRYPESERRSLGNLENMRIRAPDGTEIPFSAVAEGELGRGFATINRTDGRRVVTVSADIDRATVSPEEVMASLNAGPLRELLARHPGVSASLEGEQRERHTALSGLFRAFGGALLVIYALLAVPLRSYTQPLVIMAAIPFGIVGAILGHFIMGWDLVFFSLLGIVALSGVVVNDSLVLVDFINRERQSGLPLEKAIREAGGKRFRAIFLTSATTFAGLMPMMFNASEATFFIVPIAISLAFGVLMATAITLFIVPCGYQILDDLTHLGQRGEATHDPAPEPVAAR